VPVTGFDQIEHASLTDVGIRRSHNQDAHATLLAGDTEQWQGQGHVFLVADGMGAHAVGELASELACSIIPHTYHKYAHQGPIAALRKAFIEANASIHARGQQNREFEGMGTTSTALLLRPEGALVGHVGDSRAYRVRDGHIEQLTFDHSLVWELARRQGVDPEGLRGIPSNVIVRSLGPEPLVQVDVEGPHPFQEGDIFLLCSDGLSGQISDSEIGAIAGSLPPAEACHFLVNLANLRGGPDNITVLIIRVGSDPGSVAEPAPRPPWYRRVPWPFSSLLLGVLLAAGASALFYWQFSTLGVFAFILAAVAILVGLVGLGVWHAQEKRRLAAEPDLPRRPKVYRKVACQVERASLDKLAKATLNLKQQVESRQWEVDWEAHKQHLELAENLATQSNLTEAFREYCRAMRPLTDAIQRHRGKGEEFRPFWEKE
jgi:protein phosphatase